MSAKNYFTDRPTGVTDGKKGTRPVDDRIDMFRKYSQSPDRLSQIHRDTKADDIQAAYQRRGMRMKSVEAAFYRQDRMDMNKLLNVFVVDIDRDRVDYTYKYLSEHEFFLYDKEASALTSALKHKFWDKSLDPNEENYSADYAYCYGTIQRVRSSYMNDLLEVFVVAIDRDRVEASYKYLRDRGGWMMFMPTYSLEN